MQRLTNFDGPALVNEEVLGTASESRVSFGLKQTPRSWRVKAELELLIRGFLTKGFGITLRLEMLSSVSGELNSGLESIV